MRISVKYLIACFSVPFIFLFHRLERCDSSDVFYVLSLLLFVYLPFSSKRGNWRPRAVRLRIEKTYKKKNDREPLAIRIFSLTYAFESREPSCAEHVYTLIENLQRRKPYELFELSVLNGASRRYPAGHGVVPQCYHLELSPASSSSSSGGSYSSGL